MVYENDNEWNVKCMTIWMIVLLDERAKWGTEVSHLFSYSITFVPSILHGCVRYDMWSFYEFCD